MTRFLFALLLLLCACDSATSLSPTTGPDPDPDPDPQPTLADRLAGTWYLKGATCGGEPEETFDGADDVSLTFASSSLEISLISSSCITTLPMRVSYDDAASKVSGPADGTVSCVPADCNELCGLDAAVLLSDGVAADVALNGDTFTLSGDDAKALPSLTCELNGHPPAAVWTLDRDGMPPDAPFDIADIDPTVCDDFDPFAADRTVYYVAQNEPGADNDACDGLAPTDEGAGHCPFKDFAAEHVRQTLFLNQDFTFGARSITIAVRTGVYNIEPIYSYAPDALPLWLHGAGTSKAESVALIGYNGEAAVLDGTCAPDLPGCDSPEDPGRIWNILALRGDWVRVEGLTFDNVHKWNITVAASNACIIGNTFIGSYGSDSDSMKSFGGSGPNVIVRNNEFHTGFEQALDGTSARGWLIEDNYIHDAPDRGIGFKFGASGNIVRNNVFANLGGAAVSLGGGSSPHYFPYEAQNLLVELNRASNLGDSFAEVFACKNCMLRDNDVEGGRLGIARIASDEVPSGCPGGCPLSTSIEISGNRLRHIVGGGTGEELAPPNLFVLLDPPAIDGFVADDNLYCTEPGSVEIFAVAGTLHDFASWKAAVMTDATSRLEPSTSPSCTGW